MDPTRQLLASLGVNMSGKEKYRPPAPEPDQLGELVAAHRGETAGPGTQLEMRFGSEVAGASWADQRAHNEVIDSLVERLRRQGL